MPQPLDEKQPLSRLRVQRRELLRRSGASRHSRMVPWLTVSKPGDFAWTVMRHHRPDATAMLSIQVTAEQRVDYEVAYHLYSGWWLVLEPGMFTPEWFRADPFDQLWEAQGRIGMSRDEALALALRTHGLLAPWIGTTTQAATLRRRCELAQERWALLMSDPDDLGTVECPGCDGCDVEGVRTFHRVRADNA